MSKKRVKEIQEITGRINKEIEKFNDVFTRQIFQLIGIADNSDADDETREKILETILGLESRCDATFRAVKKSVHDPKPAFKAVYVTAWKTGGYPEILYAKTLSENAVREGINHYYSAIAQGWLPVEIGLSSSDERTVVWLKSDMQAQTGNIPNP